MSDVVKNDVFKKTVYDKLAAKVNSIDTSDFFKKTKYQTDKTELEEKNSWSDWVSYESKTHWIGKQNSRR